MRLIQTRRPWAVPALFVALATSGTGCGNSLPPTGSTVEDSPALRAAQGEAYAKVYDAKGKLKGSTTPTSGQSSARRNSGSSMFGH